MLETIIQEMNNGAASGRFRFRQQAGDVALSGHVDRHSRLPRNQERLIAIILSRPVRVNAGRAPAAAAIASGKHVDGQPPLFERLGQCDGQRRLARAAGRKVAYANYGPTKAADWFQASAKAEFAEHEGCAVSRNERQDQTTGQ
jgi:hypothetical protein